MWFCLLGLLFLGGFGGGTPVGPQAGPGPLGLVREGDLANFAALPCLPALPCTAGLAPALPCPDLLCYAFEQP